MTGEEQDLNFGETLSLDETMLFGGKPIDTKQFEPQNKTVAKIDKDLRSVTLSNFKMHRTAIYMLYYRNVPRDIVMVEIGDYETLRKLEQEIRLMDPGNYLALHEMTPVTEDRIPLILADLFSGCFELDIKNVAFRNLSDDQGQLKQGERFLFNDGFKLNTNHVVVDCLDQEYKDKIAQEFDPTEELLSRYQSHIGENDAT